MNEPRRYPTWQLAAGRHTTAITDQVATMVHLDDPDLAARLWTAQHESGADGALELLLRGGILAIPDFVLIEVEGDTYRVVLRGKATVVAHGADGQSSYEGTNVRLAAEHLIADPTAIFAGFAGGLPAFATLTGSGPSTGASTTDGDVGIVEYAMNSGFGLFEWIASGAMDPQLRGHVTPTTEMDGRALSAPPAAVDTPSGAELDDATATGYPDPETGTDGTQAETPGPFADIEAFAGPVPDQALAGAPDGLLNERRVDGPVLDDADDAPVDDAAVDDAPVDDGVAITAPAEDAFFDLISPVDATDGHEGDLSSDAEDDGDGERYADIFGATMQRSVIDAAVRPIADDGIDDPSADVAVALGAASVPTVGAAPSPATATVTPEHTIPGRDEDDADGRTLPPERVSDDTRPPDVEAAPDDQNVPVQQFGDHDGHTVSRAELATLGWSGEDTGDGHSAVAVDGAANGGGPRVQSVRCAGGHDNPPHRAECGQCQLPLDGEPILVPRPPLGTLTFSTGDEISLDRPVLVGRRPDISGLTVSELPREVAIDVGDGLSRSHALFSITGWQVRVEDLGSTNHTTIRLPGQPAQRLRVGEPVPITDGTLIDLGGEVTCRYDVNI